MTGVHVTIISVASIAAITALMLTGTIPPATSAKLADAFAVFVAWFVGWIMRQPNFAKISKGQQPEE